MPIVIFYVRRNNSWKTKLLKRKNLIFFTVFGRFLFDIGQQESKELLKLQITWLCAKGSFWGKTVVLTGIYIFKKIFSECEQIVFDRIFKVFPRSRMELFTEKRFIWKNHAISGFMQKFCPNLWWKSFGKIVKTTFHLSRGACLLKNFRFEQIWLLANFGASAKFFW